MGAFTWNEAVSFCWAQHESHPSTPCPTGWIDSPNFGCFLFHGSQAFTWNEAVSFCWSQHESHLVEIFSAEQQEFVSERAELLEMEGGAKQWWIGASDSNREGNWYWTHALREVGYSAWGPRGDGQPNIQEAKITLIWSRRMATFGTTQFHKCWDITLFVKYNFSEINL